jgi:hypothetical protein
VRAVRRVLEIEYDEFKAGELVCSDMDVGTKVKAGFPYIVVNFVHPTLSFASGIVTISIGIEKCSYLAERFRPADAHDVWRSLGTVPVMNERITDRFLHFGPGTQIEDIWRWIEVQFDISVASLMYKD